MIVNTSTGKSYTSFCELIGFRDQLNDNVQREQYLLLVDIDDLSNFDQKLGSTVRTYPLEYLKIVSISPPFTPDLV